MSDRASQTPPPVSTSQQIPDTTDTDVQVKEEESAPLLSPTTSVAPTEPYPDAPSSSPTRSPRRTEAQRLAAFRKDPQVQEVEPQRALCRACQRWIRLAPNYNYASNNWTVHKQRCSYSAPITRRTPSRPHISPSSRVATAERKIALLNDPQVKVCLSGSVQCGSCMSMVALGGEVDYDLTRWIEHKEKCVPTTPAPITPQGSTHRSRIPPPTSSASQVSAGGSVRSPTPVDEGLSGHSTETTAVTDNSSPAVQAGVKRAREEEPEDEEQAAEDARPMNRPRTETYVAPERAAPSLFGWFMQPLKEFARGFREGLGST